MQATGEKNLVHDAWRYGIKCQGRAWNRWLKLIRGRKEEKINRKIRITDGNQNRLV